MIKCIKVPKSKGQISLQIIKKHHKSHSKYGAIISDESVLIPIIDDDELNNIKVEIEKDVGGFVVENRDSCRFHARKGVLVQNRNEHLLIRKEMMKRGIPNELIVMAPQKWTMFGNSVLLLRNFPSALFLELKNKDMVESFIGSYSYVLKNCQVIIKDGSCISGELRIPEERIILYDKRTTSHEDNYVLHVENNVKYRFDFLKIMFSQGNGIERIRFKESIEAKNEIVIDMFAGIGYFSLPLALSNEKRRPSHIYSIEKNPNSYKYLVENVRENNVDNIVTPLLGDNMSVGDSFLFCLLFIHLIML